MRPLEGTTALVTGASRGIGRQVCHLLAEAGARVWCCARSAEALSELAREIGGEAVVVDLTDDVALWDALEEVGERLGGAPDLIVNAAGVFGLSPIRAETVKAFDEHLAVNLRAAFLVTRAFLPDMVARARGTIVNVGSVAGRRAFPENGSYAASKFGLRGFHEVLCTELRGTGVRATLLEPAATDTPLWDRVDLAADPNLPQRADMLRANDVAEAVLFVATRPPSVSIPLLQVEHA